MKSKDHVIKLILLMVGLIILKFISFETFPLQWDLISAWQKTQASIGMIPDGFPMGQFIGISVTNLILVFVGFPFVLMSMINIWIDLNRGFRDFQELENRKRENQPGRQDYYPRLRELGFDNEAAEVLNRKINRLPPMAQEMAEKLLNSLLRW